MSDCEALVAAAEDAQRILSVYNGASPSLSGPAIVRAVGRLKNRQHLSLLK